MKENIVEEKVKRESHERSEMHDSFKVEKYSSLYIVT
jgi:hypothetical protein